MTVCRVAVLVLTGLLLTVVSCFSVSVNALHHEPKKAGQTALEFAKVAFVENDVSRAYDLTAGEFADQFSPSQVTVALAQMHPDGRPATVSLGEYEPIPGQAAMNIFLTGERAGETFYYRILMLGTSSQGYKVGGFYRSNGPPPPSNLRKPISD
jgi:hypothetical protein